MKANNKLLMSIGGITLLVASIFILFFTLSQKKQNRVPSLVEQDTPLAGEVDALRTLNLENSKIKLVPRSHVENIFYNEKRTLYKYTMDPTSSIQPRWVRQPYERI
jgi:hypothetical protein